MDAPTTPAVHISSGTLEALKWCALACMTIDHVNAYLMGHRVQGMYAIGRLAFPLFGFAFAYNLRRPGFLAAYPRQLRKLVLVGLLSQLILATMGLPFAQLNILFTLAAGATLAYACAQVPGPLRPALALALAVLFGAVVDYGAAGVAYLAASYWLCGRADARRAALWLVACAALYSANRNHYALLAAPLLAIAPYLDIRLGRARRAFYVYYPLHLGLIALLFPFAPALAG